MSIKQPDTRIACCDGEDCGFTTLLAHAHIEGFTTVTVEMVGGGHSGYNLPPYYIKVHYCEECTKMYKPKWYKTVQEGFIL